MQECMVVTTPKPGCRCLKRPCLARDLATSGIDVREVHTVDSRERGVIATAVMREPERVEPAETLPDEDRLAVGLVATAWHE